MGQRLDVRKDKDWEGVDWLASQLKEWATAISLGHPIIAHDDRGVLFQLLTDGGMRNTEPTIVDAPEGNGPRSAGRPFHHLLGDVVAETYHAEVRIIPNLNVCYPYCLEVRFKYARVPPRHGNSGSGTASVETAIPPLVLPVSAAERLIYVRVDQDGSGVAKRDVRSVRRDLGGYLNPDLLDAPVLNLRGDAGAPDITWQLGSVQRSRGIYWNEKCRSADLRPQLLIALAQLGVVQVDERVVRELSCYLRKNFGISIKLAVNKCQLDAKEIAELACEHILRCYSFPEHPHGFRLYVKLVLRWSPGSGRADYQPEFDASRDSYTVPEAAFQLAVSKDILYRFIRQKRVQSWRSDDGLIRISRAEFLKIEDYQLKKRERMREVEDLRNQHGKSFDAARKAVYRRKGRLGLPKSTSGL